MPKALIASVLTACALAGWLAANVRQPPLEPVQFSQRFLEALGDIESAKPATLSENQLREFRNGKLNHD